MRLVFNPFTGTLDFVEVGAAVAPAQITTEAGLDHLLTEASDIITTEGS